MSIQETPGSTVTAKRETPWTTVTAKQDMNLKEIFAAPNTETGQSDYILRYNDGETFDKFTQIGSDADKDQLRLIKFRSLMEGRPEGVSVTFGPKFNSSALPNTHFVVEAGGQIVSNGAIIGSGMITDPETGEYIPNLLVDSTAFNTNDKMITYKSEIPYLDAQLGRGNDLAALINSRFTLVETELDLPGENINPTGMGDDTQIEVAVTADKSMAVARGGVNRYYAELNNVEYRNISGFNNPLTTRATALETKSEDFAAIEGHKDVAYQILGIEREEIEVEKTEEKTK